MNKNKQSGIILVMTLLILSIMTALTMIMLERTMLMLKAAQHVSVDRAEG